MLQARPPSGGRAVPSSGGIGQGVAATDNQVTPLNHCHRAATPRPSACPGLLRIVAARDGGICRIKLPGGRLSADQSRAIATAAKACASGVLEATNRANLQVRGVHPGREDELIARLLEAGLGAASAGGDDVRNLMLSPAAGHDPQALLDTRTLAAALLARLEGESRWHTLSPKFAIQLDGGERLAMLEHPHDLWLSALPGDGSRYAFGLAGCPPQRSEDAPALASVPAQQALELVLGVLALFLDCATPEQTRMRHLLQTLPATAFLARLRALQPSLDLRTDDELAAWRRAPAEPLRRFAVQAQREAGLCQVGAQSVLGRLSAGQLRGLAELAERHGDASLRLTPWQGTLLPNVPAADAPGVLQGLESLDLLTDAGAPLSRLIACTGSAGCARALADTKGDARRLAALLPAGTAAPAVHLSGCPRSCAAAHTAAFTLLATGPARYQLLQRTPGVAGFGRVLAEHLTIEQAAVRLAESPICPELRP